MNKEQSFTAEKIAAVQKIPSTVLADMKIDLHQNADDFIHDRFTLQMTAKIYTDTVDERVLVYHCERPTFLDWLLRRRKRVEFDFKAKDLLLAPPKNGTARIYAVSEKTL